ncbi:MAG: energy-coupling factor transporter ATPase [Erysipelothrix sp.]|nr:energy-coupling factor transporter ATPase [Erysipelothrix sp.]
MSIKVNNLSYTYNEGSPFELKALKNINLELDDNKVIAIVGATGSGKTTLVQHFNALLLPTHGSLEVNGKLIEADVKPEGLKALRKNVGLVFQFPEYQLFEETVVKDVAFGPKNFGVSEAESLEIAKKYLKLVNISEDLYERSPLDLSGGQKRRVAIAGILALDSNTLVLDEPTAGLDPQGALEMMELFINLHKLEEKTIIIVTHDMEQVLNYCEEVVVIDHGEIAGHYSVSEFFNEKDLLSKLDIEMPSLIKLREDLINKGFKNLDNILNAEDLVKAIKAEVEK